MPAERNLVFSVQGALWPFFGFVGNLVGGLLPALFAFLLDMTMAKLRLIGWRCSWHQPSIV